MHNAPPVPALACRDQKKKHLKNTTNPKKTKRNIIHPLTPSELPPEAHGAAQAGSPFPGEAAGCKKHSLPGTQLDGEGAAPGVHLEGGGLAAGGGPAAVLAVDEQLPDLLGHRDVVHHHRQLGVVHGALLCQGGKGGTVTEGSDRAPAFLTAPVWKLGFSAFSGEGSWEELGTFTQGLRAVIFGLSWGLGKFQFM